MFRLSKPLLGRYKRVFTAPPAEDRPDHHRTPEAFLQQLDPELLASYTPAQLQAIKDLLEKAIPKPAPKLVNLRFEIDLLFESFYFVLFVGKNRRKQRRRYSVSWIEHWGNTLVAIIVLLSLNLAISFSVLLLAYLAKSFVGIDLFPNAHLGDVIRRL
jgi:hypothetical protein